MGNRHCRTETARLAVTNFSALELLINKLLPEVSSSNEGYQNSATFFMQMHHWNALFMTQVVISCLRDKPASGCMVFICQLVLMVSICYSSVFWLIDFT
jgi:hypothetical protein